MAYSVILVEHGSLAKAPWRHAEVVPQTMRVSLNILRVEKVLCITTSQNGIKILSFVPLPLFLELVNGYED